MAAASEIIAQRLLRQAGWCEKLGSRLYWKLLRDGSEGVSSITSIGALLSVRSGYGRQGTVAGERQARLAHGHPPNQSERSGRGTRYWFPRVFLLRAGR